MNNSKKEYELYKLKWMLDHGHTLADLVESISKYASEIEADGEFYAVSDYFDMWEQEDGFNGEIWACYDEWLDSCKS